MKTVTLKTAYHWHCDECSAENFALPMRKEMCEDEKEAHYRYFHGINNAWEPLPEGWEQFECVYIPDEVTCCECGATFHTDDERMGGWPID